MRAAAGRPVREARGAEGSLHVGDRDQAEGPAGLVDDHRPSNSGERRALQQAGHVLLSTDHQSRVTVGDLSDATFAALVRA